MPKKPLQKNDQEERPPLPDSPDKNYLRPFTQSGQNHNPVPPSFMPVLQRERKQKIKAGRKKED
jgi:hypothetical protein